MKAIIDDCEVLSVSLMKTIDSLRDDIIIIMRTDEEILSQSGFQAMKLAGDRIRMALAIEHVVGVYCGEKFYPKEYTKSKEKKPYGVGYVPGTYDLLHCGHLENIRAAAELCDVVVVGVNADSLVWRNKNVKPRQNQKTRMYVMKHLEGVDHVILVETNNKSDANVKIAAATKRSMDVIILGEDLKGKAINDEELPEGCELVYTSRTAQQMQQRSSTVERAYIAQLEERNRKLEEENSALQRRLAQFSMQVDDE